MDFDQLTTFMEVAKLGSFSRAGQKVFRSQSAVSAQIRQLEEEYGDRLLDRSGKTVRLTPAGEVLFEYVTRLLTLRQESLRAVAPRSLAVTGLFDCRKPPPPIPWAASALERKVLPPSAA